MPPASEAPGNDIDHVDDAERAAALLDPLRIDLVARLRTPRSTTELAAAAGLPRQKVLYHLKALHRAAWVRKAGRRRRRGFHEQRWVASASGYVVTPDVLGELRADPAMARDRLGEAYLLALAGELSSDLVRARREASAQGKSIATLALDAEVRFESAAQRERFADALRDAVVRVIAEHASPALAHVGAPASGRPYRLLVGAWPVPASARTPFGTRAARDAGGDAVETRKETR